MKILFLLFAVVFLVFQTQSEAVVVTKNEAEAQAPDAVEAEAQDDAAEISSPDSCQSLAMKILFLLFAVVFLVFQTQSEAVVVTKNEAEAQAPDAVEAEAQDDAAEISSPDLMPQEAPMHCARQLGHET
ncbi:unnamed protein product [Natator depressus]